MICCRIAPMFSAISRRKLQKSVQQTRGSARRAGELSTECTCRQSARVTKRRSGRVYLGVHPYADPHWYDNIYILHIRSGPYTRSPIPHCWLSATSAFDWHYWSRRWHQITFLFAYIRGPVWAHPACPSLLQRPSFSSRRVLLFFVPLPRRRRLDSDFRSGAPSPSRGYTRVIFPRAEMHAGCRCNVDRRRRFGRDCKGWGCGTICYTAMYIYIDICIKKLLPRARRWV